MPPPFALLCAALTWVAATTLPCPPSRPACLPPCLLANPLTARSEAFARTAICPAAASSPPPVAGLGTVQR